MIDQAGQLDRRIVIQGYSESTDAFGQEVKSYSTLATVWANVKEKVGSEGEKGDMLASTKKVEFIIRYRTDVDEQMRVSYNSNIYKIQTIQVADERKAYLKLICLWSDAQ
jgi:SPP1 family predicted phage head-tail adaptor